MQNGNVIVWELWTDFDLGEKVATNILYGMSVNPHKPNHNFLGQSEEDQTFKTKNIKTSQESYPHKSYTMLRKRSTCHFCYSLGENCGLVAGKCPNRPCDSCNGRHRHGRCKKA